jgi:hypothetical protein
MNLVSQEAVQDMGIRATTTLNKVSHFFNFHMIDNYGCDYSTSGLAMDYLESKLKAFFDRRIIQNNNIYIILWTIPHIYYN